MATKAQVYQELDSLISLNEVVDTYEEIAAGRIRKTRDYVIKTRGFLDEIKLVFQQVRVSYKKEAERLAKKKTKKGTFNFLNHNGKTLYVLLSSNTGLYGDIVKRTFDLFVNDIREKTSGQTENSNHDVAIVGKLGLGLFTESGLKLQYKYFDFPDNAVDANLLKPLVEYMLSYETVIVYFGKFENLVKQTPVAYDVSATPIEEVKAEQMRLAKFIFEPSLEKILEFFESAIFASITEQTIRESQLGKFASRMVSLDKALGNIKKRTDQTKFILNTTVHRERNRRQLETFSSMALWNK